MSSDPQIDIEAIHLGIKYRIYRRQIFTLKEAVLNLFRGYHYDSFWALRDMTLQIPKGQRVGIIGPNGAGKSTFLKAIARVLPASEGTIDVQGRVAPLLELGGGFNPELTGRENVFLNGAILGRSRREIEEKLEGIIEFAGVNDFIDAPLRTFSSGMRARLAFAVAMEVEPEILLLDEIFSVGDQEFREKATARTEELFTGERTSILVSHSLDLVARLCERAIYLRAGRIVADGPTEEVVGQYRQDATKGARG